MVARHPSRSRAEALRALIARIGLAAGVEVQPVAPALRLRLVVPPALLRCPCPCSIDLPDDAD